MNNKALSIVVPTKNRTQYMKSFIDMCSKFVNEDFELVIQDNSDDPTELKQYLSDHHFSFVSYFYNSSNLTMSENSNLGIKNSIGEYVCFMGDDDLLSGSLVDFVQYMKREKIDAAVFNKAIYNWPGVSFKVHSFPNLVIPKFSGKVKELNVNNEYRALLKRGTTSLDNIPQLYHGVVKREILMNVRQKCGTFFPGPSPDIAVAVSVSKLINKYVYCDAPLISSGVSPKSSAGLGAKHMHKGDLKSVPFLPDNIEEIWDKRIPMTWTGPTIYAESSIEAIKAIGASGDIDQYFNFPYFFAFFDIFCPENKSMSKELMKKNHVNKALYQYYKMRLFFMRCKTFLKNTLLMKFQIGGDLFDNINNTADAEQIIDNKLIGFDFSNI